MKSHLDRKFIETKIVENYSILTPTGFKPIKKVLKTIPYDVWYIELENGDNLKGADTHILYKPNNQEVFIKDIKVDDLIDTDTGFFKCIKVEKLDILAENMYDIEVDSEDHQYYANGFKSHNTTMSCIYMLWFAMFNKDKTIAILANKADTAKSILADIKFAYEHMPKYLKPGVAEYNVNSIVFDNGTRIFAKATSIDALRGESISLLFQDETAFIPSNIAEAFFTSNFPTLSTGGRAIFVSTPNGTGNLFYKLWKDAIDKRNDFFPVQVDWWEVPGRDEKWKAEQIKILGTVKFNQEFNNRFQGSTVTLIDADVIINTLKWSEPMLQPDDFTKVWQMPKSGRKYVICIDTGGGVGSDFSIMNVFDITEFPNEPAEQVAIWKNNKTPPNEFADVLKAACEYWNDAYTIGETNGLSAEVLSRLFNDYEYENIFMDMENGGTFGVFSTRKSKPVAALNFKELLEKELILLHDSETIDEIGIFEEVSPGVFKAKTGKDLHDDCVITCLWLGYFLRSSYFEDEKSMWGNENGYSKQFSEGADQDNEDANIEALEAFLEADKKQHGEDWLEQDEWKGLRY